MARTLSTVHTPLSSSSCDFKVVHSTELVPKERMVIRAYDYYESDIILYGNTEKMSAYMIRGVSAAFMALAYSGKYDPNAKRLYEYKCEQVKGIEYGDPYGEFVVTRA